MTRRVVVLDYGSGNIRSAQRALERVGAEVAVTADSDAAREADGLVVPGVGAFAACMAGIDAVGGSAVVRSRLDAGRPVLGICVGMQVMFSRGEEHGLVTSGIGVVDGVVRRLQADVLPHMGWNTVETPSDSGLFRGVSGERFYFVHSYGVVGEVSGVSPTWASHGERFVAAFESPGFAATQFHPEKSGDAGAQLLRNWLETL